MDDSTLDYWMRTIIYEIQTPFGVARCAIGNFVRTFRVDPVVALGTVAAISLLTAAWLIPVLVVRITAPRQEGDRQRRTTAAGKERGA